MIRLLTGVLLLTTLTIFAQENRTITGVGNNPNFDDWGSTGTDIIRITSANYIDGESEMDDRNRPTPRQISNQLFSQVSDRLNQNHLSDFVWLFGQFIDHDLSLTENAPSAESFLLEIPEDDEFFGQDAVIALSRNQNVEGTGQQGIAREYHNEVTSFIDGSMVYGSSQERADWLRTFEGGRLWTSTSGPVGSGELLPWNTTTKEYGGGSFIDNTAPHMEGGGHSKFFVCGDVRANENPLLLAMHTLFVREHNRLCAELQEAYPNWTDEQLYQRARKLVGAYLQSITYNEWLPAMGIDLPEYTGYQENLQPAIYNVFSAAAFRIGHTMIDSDIIRMGDDGREIAAGNLSLSEGFFNPLEILNARGIDPYFKGMATQVMQDTDCKVIDELRNFLFDGQNRGLDLASINIFRGRDRGLADYNTLREDFGLAPIGSFDQITDDAEDVAALRTLYGDDLTRIDAWVGMLSEQHASDDAIFGELIISILREQFKLLRNGDRFYFENDAAFTRSDIENINNTTLRDILMRNTDITLMQPNVFVAMPHSDIPVITVLEEPLATTIFPNPVLDMATVKIYSEQDAEATYKLVNITGLVLESGTIDLRSGPDNYLYFSMLDYPRGIYTLLLEQDGKYTSSSIVR
jgi:hypothetical protein